MKDFADRKYQTILNVKVWFRSVDGSERFILDAIDGLNIGHAWHRAEQNWPAAHIIEERYTQSRSNPNLPE